MRNIHFFSVWGDMFKFNLVLGVICAFILLGSVESYAKPKVEMLDDASIHKVYDDQLASVMSGARFTQFLDKRLDASFTYKATIATTMNGQTQTATDQADKSKQIQNAIDAYTHAQIQDFKADVTKITYSENHQFAYVTNSAQGVFITDTKLQDGRTVKARLEQVQACVEIMAPVDSTLKFMKAECNINQRISPIMQPNSSAGQ